MNPQFGSAYYNRALTYALLSQDTAAKQDAECPVALEFNSDRHRDNSQESSTELAKGAGSLKLLALELEERLIGLAVSYPSGRIALCAGYYDRSDLSEDLRGISAEAQNLGIDGLVVGIPYGLDSAAGPATKQALDFIQALKKLTALPVYLVDERSTTVESQGSLRKAGEQPSQRRARVDETPATLILKQFLDQLIK